MADNKLLDKALDVAKKIYDDYYKSETIAYIAKKMTDNNLFDNALNVANDIDNDNLKTTIIVYIIKEMVNNGLFEEALKNIEYIKSNDGFNYRLETMTHIIKNISINDEKALQKIVKVIETINHVIDNSDDKLILLKYIVDTFSDNKEFCKQIIFKILKHNSCNIKSNIIKYISDNFPDFITFKMKLSIFLCKFIS